MHVPFVRHAVPAILCASALAVSAQTAVPDKKAKPSVSVKVSPAVGFTPARMVLTAELKGGADDYQEFYCASARGIGRRYIPKPRLTCNPKKRAKAQSSAASRSITCTNISGESVSSFPEKTTNCRPRHDGRKVLRLQTARVRPLINRRDDGNSSKLPVLRLGPVIGRSSHRALSLTQSVSALGHVRLPTAAGVAVGMIAPNKRPRARRLLSRRCAQGWT